MASVPAAPTPSDVSTVLCDLDGVVWLAHRAIDGAPDAVARLRGTGRRVLFVTNNSALVVADQEAALAAIGVPAAGDVVTSAMAAAALLRPGERVVVCAGPGVVEAVERAGAVALRDGDGDTVIVGFHRDFDYERLRVAATAVRRGARLIGTNDDATYPTPDGPIPGGGALLAAVATAAGVDPVVAGKPFAPMAGAVRATLGPDGFDPARVVMVGDRPSTDGAFAVALGCHFALVRSGVTPAGLAVHPVPSIDAPDLAAVADLLIGADATR
jgi:4-nitrophenyl phosphatase